MLCLGRWPVSHGPAFQCTCRMVCEVLLGCGIGQSDLVVVAGLC